MTSDNLTRDEAATRSALITVASYQVDLDLTGGDSTFRSVSVARFGCAAPGSSTFINLTAPAVREITLNDAPVSLDAFDGNRIALTGLAGENVLRVVADCAYSRSGEGLHRFTDPADGHVYLYSDLETFDAHRVYACFDQPDMKASYELAVTAPADWQVVSNMAPESSVPDGAALRWHFPPTPVMPTYITAVAAGPYHVVRDEHDGIPLGVYCRQSLASYLDADEIFEVTRQGFDFYHNSFGIKYPFGKYDQLFVPEFKEGAMENAGCVTFVEAYIFRSRVTDFAREARGETILHEMAHMWFGDLVTMRWWDDLWLNESFATWAGTLAQAEATRWTSAWTTFAQLYKAWAYRQDQLPSTHPIAADIGDIAAVEVNFDGITYAKGASVLKQLVAYVGRENFLDGVRKYFGAHAWGNATLADLLAALEETSGRDLTAWSAQWLQTAGVNTLRPSYSVDADGHFTEFAVEQEAPATHPVLRSHRIAIGLYDRTETGLVRRQRVETDVAGPRTVIPELAGQARPDLVLVNDEDLTYAKIRLDDHSLRTLVDSIGEFTDSLPAALCWSAAWDMVRDAEMAARNYVRLVLAGVSSVADISVVQTLLRQAGQAVRRFADPGRRPAGLALMAGALRELLHDAPAGLGHPARLCPGFRGGGHRRRRPGLAGRAAGWFGAARRPHRRHRPALVAARAAGEPRRPRERRDRCRTGPGCDRRGRTARRGVPRRDPDRAGQAGGLGDDDRRRADDRDVPRRADRLRRPGPAGAARTLPGEVLRGGRGRVAELVLGDGPGLRHRRVRRVPDLAGDGGNDRRLHPGRGSARRAAPPAHRGPG